MYGVTRVKYLDIIIDRNIRIISDSVMFLRSVVFETYKPNQITGTGY